MGTERHPFHRPHLQPNADGAEVGVGSAEALAHADEEGDGGDADVGQAGGGKDGAALHEGAQDRDLLRAGQLQLPTAPGWGLPDEVRPVAEALGRELAAEEREHVGPRGRGLSHLVPGRFARAIRDADRGLSKLQRRAEGEVVWARRRKLVRPLQGGTQDVVGERDEAQDARGLDRRRVARRGAGLRAGDAGSGAAGRSMTPP